MKAHEVKELRKQTNCTMVEAVSHLKNRDLKIKIKNKEYEKVLETIVDTVFPTLR